MYRYRRVAVMAVLCILGMAAALSMGRPSKATAPTLRLVASSTPPSGLAPVTVALHVSEAVALGSWELTLAYDPDFLTLTDVEMAPELGNPESTCDPTGARCVLLLGPRPALEGKIVGAVTYGAGAGLNGDGMLALFHFRPTGRAGLTSLTMIDPLVTDIRGQAVTPLTQGVTVELGHTPAHRVFLPAVTNQ